MANPQKENGYTAIANEILEHLVLPGINGSEYRIILFVLRKTYGYSKKQDIISLSQFEKATSMKRSHVVSTIKELVHKSILGKQKNLYSINKNWERWLVHKRIPQSTNVVTGSPQKGSKSSPQKHTYKRKKATITKERGARPNTTNQFFKGIKDLMDKSETKESASMRTFLQQLAEKYPGAPKDVMWSEIKKFYNYWTEMNSTGTKERWQKQTVFQVDRRLVTWFGKINQFQRSDIKRGVADINKKNDIQNYIG